MKKIFFLGYLTSQQASLLVRHENSISLVSSLLYSRDAYLLVQLNVTSIPSTIYIILTILYLGDIKLYIIMSVLPKGRSFTASGEP